MSQSQGPGPLPSSAEERALMRADAASPDVRAERLEAVRIEADRLRQEVSDAMVALGNGVHNLDDEALVRGCRKLVALGMVAKGLADQLHLLGC